VALALTAGAIGNALPPPWSTFVPMLVNDDFIRDEFVHRHAVADVRTPCVAVLGDSRAGFNISGAILDTALPPDCRTQNYGFPAMRLEKITRLVSDLDPKIAGLRAIVISVNEAMLTHPKSDDDSLRIDYGQHLENAARDWLLQWRWIRSAYLGHHRLSQYLRASLRMSLAPDTTGWIWMSERKQWRYLGLEKRELISLPSYREEVRAMAHSYFVANTPRPDARALLERTLAQLSMHSGTIVVVIPPAETSFQEQAEIVAPGVRDRIINLIRDVSRDARAHLIDCSSAGMCDVDREGYADPVHLNDRGIEAYSHFLARQISFIANLGSQR
jgi:hypothetical protein